MLNSHSKTHGINLRRLIALALGLALVGLALMREQNSISAALMHPEKKNLRVRASAAGGQSAERQGQYASSATMMSPIPFAPIDVDRTDDVAAAAACTVAPNDCSLRGAVAFANVNPATTINVPAGTYNLTIPGPAEGFSGNNSIGDLDIRGNNTSIAGAGAATTIINQTIAGHRVIEVNPFLDATFITGISGVTISGGRETTGIGGGGIISGSINNVLTVSDCVFSGNSATGAGTFGGGGISHSGGSLTITGTTFSNNSTSGSGGGVGYSAGDPLGRFPSAGTLAVSGSTFNTNTANSVGGGGGALDLFNYNLSASTYNVNTSTFSGNRAPTGSGGAIICESGPLTATRNSFTTNSAGNAGGAVFAVGSTSITFSRLVGNSVPVPTSGLTLFRAGTIFTADDNWWGVNAGPSPNDFRGSGGVTITPATWLQLQASGSPNQICTGGSSNVTANIKKRNSGVDLTVELNGLPPFPATFISATPAIGTVSGASANFVNGEASATFTGGATAGTGNVDVTADNQTVTTAIEVQVNATSDPADVAVCEGDTATFSTTASGPGPFTFVWKKGATTLNNGDLGGRVTITSVGGSSSLSISNAQASDADGYTVEATGNCNTTSQSASLTVNAATTATDPSDQTVCEGDIASFSTTATGTDIHYAWTLDGSPFNGDSPSINVPTTGLTVGSHTVGLTVTGSCGTVSHTATLTVRANTVASDPADVTVCEGATASFATTATGTDLHYAWTLDGSPFNGDSPSINVPTAGMTIGAHTVGLTVTGSSCGTVSHTATLTVNANTVASDPVDSTVCEGATASFATTATGTDLHYAWTLDGSPFNGDSPSINVPTTGMTIGSHTVGLTVTGSCGTVNHTATLTVNANTTATDPVDQTVCEGATANFSTTATGTNLVYAWTLDGSPAGNTPSISVPTTGLGVGSHAIGLTVTGTCGTIVHSATLTVQASTATSDPPDQSVCKGTDATFSTIASGTGPFSYAWTLDGSPFNGNSPSITIPTGSLSTGSHTVTVTTTGSCGSATQTAILNVTNPIPVITLSSTSATMWPPNHQYQTFNVTNFVSSATGGCDQNTNLTGSVVIQSVSSDEPEDNPNGGDGNTLNDIVIAADCKSVQLRRERDGSGNGRVYTITFKVSDSFGNTSTATVKVSVPKNNNSTAVDNGAAAGYTVNSVCP
jgi:hypothetical protein